MRRYRTVLSIVMAVAVLVGLLAAAALGAAKPSVSLKTTATSAKVGHVLHLTGRVHNAKAGATLVVIQEAVGTHWRRIATADVTPTHTFAAKVIPEEQGTLSLRAAYRYKAGKATSAGLSGVVTLTVAPSPGDWSSVACGDEYSLALKSDGSLWAWGWNDCGQLGLGNTTDRHRPTRVGIANDWAAVACGDAHALALKTDGSLWAWGDNMAGELGLGTSDLAAHPAPTRVGVAADWAAVACGEEYSLALKTDGSLWAWGWNGWGRLGLGDGKDRHTPTRVGTANDWAAVAAGTSHSLALKTDGSLWAWGMNGYGWLGPGKAKAWKRPTRVGTASGWAAVACGPLDSLAVKKDGSLWAWGANQVGQLGLGDRTVRHRPTRVGVANDWAAVTGGSGQTLALKTNGTLWVWGSNQGAMAGRCGDRARRLEPTRVGLANNWAAVVGGTYHSLALKKDGSLWAWGWNDSGDLGLGDTADRRVPHMVTGGSP